MVDITPEHRRDWTSRPRRWRHTAFACFAIAFAFHSPLAAEDAAPENPDAARRELEIKRHELTDKEAKEKAIQSEVGELDAERELLNGRLVDTAGQIQRSEAQMTSIEGRLSELEAQEKVVKGSLLQRHGQISSLLMALQRMGRNPPPVLVTRREDALKMVRSAMLLASAFPDLRDQAVALGTQLDDLQRVMTSIRTEGTRLRAETDRLNEARTRLASLMDAKKRSLADRQSDLQSVRVAAAEITKSVTDLSELITRLDQTVTEKTGLGAYDAALKSERRDVKIETEPVPPPGAGSGSGPQIIAPPPPIAEAKDDPVKMESEAPPRETASAAPTAPEPPAAEHAPNDPAPAAVEPQVAMLAPPTDTKQPVVEVAPSGSSLIPGSPGRMKPSIAFASARGKLPLPAQGRKALAFGEKTQFGGQSKGIVIETRFSAQITSPCDGWVVYAGEFRSYGQLLIINAGDGYHMLLAGLSQIDVQPGQFVLTAEPVGTMSGGQKNPVTSPPVSGPVLYVELRKDGRPIDPNPWWATGQQKVQG